MPKIIVKIHHMKDKSSAGGFVNYIAKREGVDKSVNQEIVISKPTKKQTEYINELLKLCPDAKDSFEYEDYIENPTMQNASAFISIIAEQNPQIFESRETYINYISTRPNVEKHGEHGLFGMEDTVDLKKVKDEVSTHKGVIWTPIVSLKREDAARLGYDNAEMWQSLIRSKQMEMAKIFGIPTSDFKWYGAFHNEGEHPHLHMIVYSSGSNRGFIQEEDIEKIKSLLANEIFKNDMYTLTENKTNARERVSDEAKKKLSEISETIKAKDFSDSEVCQMLFDFARKLKNVKGKKVYGYLPKPLKKDVNEIFKALANDTDIQKLYGEWCGIQKKIIGIYKDSDIEFPPLWENKEFYKIRNAVIKECVKLGDDRFFIEGREDKTEMEDVEAASDDANESMDFFDEFHTDEDGASEDSSEMNNYQKGAVALSAMNLFYRLARIVENDTNQKIDGFNKTIVDSKERIEEMKKKQRLGIKMG